jgi:hypothetical protein
MNPDYEQKLEEQIDQKLKALPELRAPETLVLRVLRAIESKANLPWFRRAWDTWPTWFRLVSFLILASAFGGLCFGGWELSNAGSSLAAQKLAVPVATTGALWSAAQTLFGAAAIAFKSLGAGFVTGCIAAVILGYALCLALGAAFLRLGFSVREK